VRLRIATLNALADLPEPKGAEVRGSYASASRFLAERKYDRALEDFRKAFTSAPDFAPTLWRLALLNESMGNMGEARKLFLQYRELETSPGGRQEADLHLDTFDERRRKYDDEVAQATEILSDLLNRALNLTFNGLEDRASQYKQRSRERAQLYKKQNLKVVGGFTVPFAYAQQQLAEAGEHLANALLVLPLGAKASQLMGLVHLQANDGRSAMRLFDAVAGQNLPVAFYAQMHSRNREYAVKCELRRDRLRLIFLSSYNRQGKPAPPAKRAGADGLGDLAIDGSCERGQDFESRIVMPAEVKSIETKHGHLVLKLGREEISLAPLQLAGEPAVDGPAARRFANNYTRLFVRYPGLEESKLGAEGMTALEKIRFGYDLATSGLTIAMNLNPMGAIGALETFVQISKEVHGVAKSLHVSFAGWLKTLEDQQELQAGNSFKTIPTEAAGLAFLEEIK
jgi:tetratricopeptide (TPR) repeat protein